MIEKQIQKVEVNQIIESQIPNFLLTEENDGFVQLLKQYYISQEFQGSSVNIVENIPEYKNPDIFNNEDLISSTTLTASVEDYADEISVTSTLGWPSRYGLLKIDDEIITYTSKTDTKFLGCIRGFSGIEGYNRKEQVSSLVFSTSVAAPHTSGSVVSNLSNLFLKEFLFKSKSQFAPGFEDYNLADGLDQTLFLKRISDFYKSKGTDEAFRLLFKILYNKNVQVIKPQDYLIKPSDAEYLTSQALLVDFIEGEDLTELETLSIIQNRDDKLNLFESIASISSVETLDFGEKRLYRLILDSSTIEGKFGVSGRSKTIESVNANSTIINVDSTIGFPESGTIDYFDTFGDKITITYSSKTINQFLGCSGIIYSIPEKTTLNYANYAYIDNPFTGVRTTVKLLKVINDISNFNTNYYSSNDYVTIKSFGEYFDNDNVRLNSWIFNLKPTFNVSMIEKQSSMYKFTLLDSHEFLIGDEIELYSSLTNSLVNRFTITQIFSDTEFLGNFGDFTLDISKKYYIKKSIQKISSDEYSYLNSYIGNVSNVYTNDTDVYVASNSLPVYNKNKVKISVSKNTTKFNVTSDNLLVSQTSHNFYTGEKVYVEFSSSTELNGNYFVKFVDNESIKLSKSSSNILNQKYIDIASNQSCFVTLSSLYSKNVSLQPILRKIPKQVSTSIEKTKTTPDNGIGILINGVEILSYKSNDFIAYGPVDSVKILNGGNNYDIINPPEIVIEDNFSGIGTGCILVPQLTGSLYRIDILDPGFDIIDVPEIIISGGGGSGARASARLNSIEYSIECKSNVGVNTANNFITFEDNHKFKNGEEIYYLNLGSQAIGVGTTTLANGSVYYVNVTSPTTIKLSNSKTGALTGTDFIDFNSVGDGIHKFQSVNNKNILSSIVVESSGTGYKNSPKVITSSGINTYNSYITFEDHQFSTGDKIVYSTTGALISGLSTSATYYAIKVDKNNFRVALTEDDSRRNIYINLSSSGSGYHTFNYEPISVTLNSRNGFGTNTYNPTIRPVFLGNVDNLIIKQPGTKYGNDEILNFEANPVVYVKEASPAELKPVIVNGRIKEVIVNNSGSGYTSPPNILISGSGTGAKLNAILNESGGISSVYIENEGYGYQSNTTNITPQQFGNSLVVEAKVKKWTFDRNKKFKSTFKADDGFLWNSKSFDDSLQFYSTYLPKELRKSIFTLKSDGRKDYTKVDIDNDFNTEKSHSPIIGWSYDGCPIYGQYGYSSETGGEIKKLKSGYTINTSRTFGPSTIKYELGTFIEDYAYSASGDLDEYNGRYCVTPDFPNGIYAYFATNLEFPYVIGNSFSFVPEKANLIPYSENLNQNIDFETLKLKRYTYPYKISNNDSYYEYFTSPKDSLKFPVKIKEVSSGKINSFTIISPGENYSVGDKIINNNDGEVVGEITGTLSGITSIQTATEEYADCPIFYDRTNSLVRVYTHNIFNYRNFDSVYISGISTVGFNNLVGPKTIGITSVFTSLSVSIGNTSSTGIVTSIVLSNTSNIFVDDIIQINKERFLVLDKYERYNSILVEREYGTAGLGSAWEADQLVYNIPTSFTFFSGISTSSQTPVNIKKYFNPINSVGVSTLGVGTTITIFTGIGYTTVNLSPKSIFIPSHNYITGQKLQYFNGGGSSLGVSTDGINSFTLNDGSYVYVARYNSNEIGISTTPVGIGSTGFVGVGTDLNILYFNSLGTGFKHSFKTTYPEITVDVKKITSTITTKDDFRVQNPTRLSVLPNQTTYIKLIYDDTTRRLLINPKTSSSVNVLLNTITIPNHNYFTGDKVLYRTTGTEIGGLVNNSYYYIIRDTDSNVKLVEAFDRTFNPDYSIVNLTSSGSGTHTFYLVNPRLDLYKGNTIVFDTSDSSLSDSSSGSQVPAFSFDLYRDSNLITKYFDASVVSKTGNIGIGTSVSESNVTLITNESSPEILYYSLSPLNTSLASSSKINFIVDSDFNNPSTLYLKNSLYTGDYYVVGISSNTFEINLSNIPEKNSYNELDAAMSYSSSVGKINSIKVSSSKTYDYPQTNLSIRSNSGIGGVVYSNSNEIGSISDISSLIVTSEIPSDPTLVPVANLPQILRVDQSSSLSFVGVSSGGRKYTYPPKLIVLDKTNNSIIEEIELRPSLSGTSIGSVDIISNTKSLFDTEPKIISTNNSNGIGINTISYDSLTKTVLVSLASSFSVSSDYPFEIGQKVFVENVGIPTSTDSGFNSSDYNYVTFEVVGVNTNLGGGKPTVSYRLPNYATNSNVGIFTCITARIIPEKDLPVFNAITKTNEFFPEEEVFSSSKYGKVISYNKNSKLLKVNSLQQFDVDEIISGNSSGTKAKIIEKYNYESDFSTNALTKPFQFFNKETGKISESFQRFEDGDYHQLFSYSLKSEISYEDWKTPVLGLAHVSGYKPFSDLQVISIGSTAITDVNLNEVKSTVDLFNESSFYCKSDFDLASENSLTINENLYSNEIYFNSKVISDFIKSKTNRALIIDDISSQFNSNPRAEKYSTISEIVGGKYVKNFIFVKDTLRTDDKALYQISFLSDDPNFELLNYGSNWTSYDLGYFDVQKVGDNSIGIQFYPYNFEYNNYNITNLSISLLDSSTSGITTQSIGTVAAIESTPRVTIASTTSPVSNQVIGFSTTKYTTTKILTIAQSDSGLVQSNELVLVHNGSEILISDYAEMISDEKEYSESTLGTYTAEISGGNVVLNFTPISGVGVTIFTHLTAITTNTGIGTTTIGTSLINTNFVSIASSTTPIPTVVCGFATTTHSASYIIAEVINTTNNEIQSSELVLINDTNNSHLVEYNVCYLNNSLGTFTSEISGSNCNLLFTPNPGIDVSIKSINYVTNEKKSVGVITFTDSEMKFQYGRYTGTNTDIKNSFQLTSNTYPLFYKEFDGSNPGIVSVTDNLIKIPSHYFVDGEKLEYSFDELPIGISTTTIVGIGTTNYLPSIVYVIKNDENSIKLAASPSDALSTPPVPLTIVSVGVGTLHSFNPEKQDTKLLLTIDNVAQSPLVPTGIIFNTTEEFSELTSLIKLTGTNDIASGDILKIDNEYIKVVNVGIATTNGIVVVRGMFDTNIVTHSSSSSVQKYIGSYLVDKNTLYFTSPPYGNIGINSEYYSNFSGRAFLRSGQIGSGMTAYSENYVFDDISSQFTGIGKTFTLTHQSNNVIGISTNNGIFLINNIPQIAGANQNYILEETGGTSTKIIFNGNAIVQSYDVNTTGIPRSGVIKEFSSNNGFGLQPLVGAGGTAVVSIAGTITSVSIGNSGSGYRSGIQTAIYVRATDPTTGISTNIGIASVSSGFVTSITITNPGSGYTSTNPPLIEIDDPLLYENLPLLGGSGTGAKVSIVVGQGSSAIDFNITNYGYGYNEGDILYVETGGSSGIQTVSSAGIAFTSFGIIVDSYYYDSFAGWTFGELQTLDDITPLIDGTRRIFTLKLNNEILDLRTNKNSLINLAANLIVIRNGIIQIPDDSYIFTGGSRLIFTEAPLPGDKIQILFYKGSSFDSELVDIEPIVKIGDNITLNDFIYQESTRLIDDILSSDTIQTNYYNGPGIVTDLTFDRSLTWCKQKQDLIINGNQISKSREVNNSKLIPVSNIISPISIGSTEIFVECANPLFKEFDDISESDLSVVILDQNAGIGTTEFASYEKLDSAKVSGDFGIISGIYTGTVGIASTALLFDFVIPLNSALRNTNVFGSATTLSGIATGYYFTLSNTNVGNGITALSINGSVVGVGTSFIDGIYQVYSTQPVSINAFGIGATTALRVTTLVNSYTGISTGQNNFFGNYSWGRIYEFNGTTTKSFNVNTQNGLTGISTSPTVLRTKQIRTPY